MPRKRKIKYSFFYTLDTQLFAPGQININDINAYLN